MCEKLDVNLIYPVNVNGIVLPPKNYQMSLDNYINGNFLISHPGEKEEYPVSLEDFEVWEKDELPREIEAIERDKILNLLNKTIKIVPKRSISGVYGASLTLAKLAKDGQLVKAELRHRGRFIVAQGHFRKIEVIDVKAPC